MSIGSTISGWFSQIPEPNPSDFNRFTTGAQATVDRFLHNAENNISNIGSAIANSNTGQAVSNLYNSFIPRLHEFDDRIGETVFGTSGRKVSGSHSGSAGSGGSGSLPAMAAINYVDAPLAQLYGMDAATAYQEALANTSHQREIQDLQRAGLNPVLAARYSGAGVFNPSGMATASTGSGSGGSGRSARDVSGALPSLMGAVATLASGKTSVGAAVSTVAEALLPAFTGK